MIIGIGSDIIALARIEKILKHNPQKFIERVFHEKEIHEAHRRFHSQALSYHHKPLIAYYAKRFAAKEAFVKALGTGFTKNIFFKDIVVLSDAQGKPSLCIFNNSLLQLTLKTPQNAEAIIHLSLTDEKDYVLAFVIIEGLMHQI